MQLIYRLAITALLGCGSHPQTPPAQPNAPHHDVAAPAPGTEDAGQRKALMRKFREVRETKVRERGAIFARIAVN